MPKVDFFSPDYQRVTGISLSEFGIDDAVEQGNAGGVAYLVTSDYAESNAIVSNKSDIPLTFEPLDHNIVIHPTSGETYSLCDCMLYNRKHLCFIELKVKGKNWLSEAVRQLESTIELFRANHKFDAYPKRSAYAANKRHPQFQYSRKELMQTFRNRYQCYLRIQRNVEI